MVNLPKLTDVNVAGKRVIVRLDLDISEGDNFRLKSSTETLKFLSENKAKTIIIGHKGRPNGEVGKSLSLEPLAVSLNAKFVNDIVGAEAQKEVQELADGSSLLLENLRFDKREEENDESFARSLAGLGELYINDAFAVSHRAHASIVGIPEVLPHVAGFNLIKEVENLGRVLESPRKPAILVISGVKEDKVEMIRKARDIFDRVLVGGRLPDYLGEDFSDPKVLVAKLNPDKEDITIHSIEMFEKEIAAAGTIVLAGVPGKYEDEGHRLGTERIFKAVTNSNAFKVVGGGDSLAVVSMYQLENKFDWISVGGGAMLEFLTKGTLPGIDALLE